MEQWLFENDVYKFYTRLFTYISRDEKFHFREVEYNRGFLYYENRMIMELITNEKRIYLAYCRLSSKIDPFGDIFTFNFDPLKADVQLY